MNNCEIGSLAVTMFDVPMGSFEAFSNPATISLKAELRNTVTTIIRFYCYDCMVFLFFKPGTSSKS